MNRLKEIEDDLQKQIELIKKTIDQYEQEKSKAEDWPQKGAIFYLPSFYHEYIVDKGTFGNVHGIDDLVKKRKFAFKTPKKAELFAKQCLLMRAMQARAEELNDGWVADWEDYDQLKFGIGNNYGNTVIFTRSSDNPFVYGISIKTKEKPHTLLNEFGDQIKELYGR